MNNSVSSINDASFNINSAIQQGGQWGASVGTGMVAFMLIIAIISYLFYN